jgi:TonB family protein
MKGYFFLSCAAHGSLLAALLILGTILSKPHLSYYAVDVFSPPSSSGASPVPPAPAPPVEAPPAPPPPKAPPQEKPIPKEAIKMPSKEKPVKKQPPKPKAPPPKPKSSSAFKAAMQALQNENPEGPNVARGPSAAPTAGAAVTGEAGPAFPYPWYLKAIADKLDKQWHPPQAYQSDTVCEVSFLVHQDGQVDDSSVEKRSGDSVFDQLALRAVLYANPLPPLPSGFSEATLRVHMKFVGKSQ